MPKIVCTPCQQTYRVDNNSIVVVTYAQETPYQLWFADEWKCPTCGHRVVSGFGDNPIWRREDGDFDNVLASYEKSWIIRHEHELIEAVPDGS